MPTCINIIRSPYNSLQISCNLGEKIPGECRKQHFRVSKYKNFTWAACPQIPLEASLPLHCWLLTLTTQPSTSKLSDNPALETMTRPNQGLSLSRSIGMGRREPRERGWQVGNMPEIPESPASQNKKDSHSKTCTSMLQSLQGG